MLSHDTVGRGYFRAQKAQTDGAGTGNLRQDRCNQVSVEELRSLCTGCLTHVTVHRVARAVYPNSGFVIEGGIGVFIFVREKNGVLPSAVA